MTAPIDRFDHPSWTTAAGTFAGYALVLLVVCLSLFVLPYALLVLT